MTVLEFLQSAREAKVEVRRLSDRVEELESQATKMTASYKAVPGGSGSQGGSPIWDLLISERQRLEKSLAEAQATERNVEEFINTLPDPKHRQVLKLRFLEGMNLERIAPRIGYESAQTGRISAAAMRAAAEEWRKMNG